MEKSNLLLAALSPGDAAALQPYLQETVLDQQRVLFEAGRLINAVYFPLDTVISLVVGLSTGEVVEAAMVGRDGVVGAAAALDGRLSLCRAIVQLGGHALVCEIGALRTVAMQSQSMLALLIRPEQA